MATVAIEGMIEVSNKTTVAAMNSTLRTRLTQAHSNFQHALLPLMESDVGHALTPKLMQLLRVWECIEIERFIPSTRGHTGRPRRERQALARAFVAKAVLGLSETSALIERLAVDVTLRNLCGFDRRHAAPTESLFSRAFAEFSAQGLAQQVHAALIENHLGGALIGHISRDSTAIAVRESVATPAAPAPVKTAKKRGRPRKGDAAQAAEPTLTRIQWQAEKNPSLEAMLAELPTGCDVGTKRNSKGYKSSWRGYKLHLDVGDGMVPIAAIITSASVHDSQVAIPLATLTAQRVTNLYDLMDAAYCSPILREHSRQLGHVPLIDHNPRRGEKIEFAPHEAQRYNERSTVERVNGRLKDSFGIHRVNVRGHAKVASHLMFAVLALTADQLLRWVT